MIPRNIEDELKETAKEFPVITITGPRQSGKTTLAKKIFGHYSYANFENLETRKLAKEDPNAFFKLYPTPLIIDEVQRLPSILSEIQVLSDELGKNGQFILTGSHQSHLEESVTQSLAGRTALLKLLPLSISELNKSGIQLDRDEYILNGFMPKIHSEKVLPTRLYRNYFETYVERDVRQIANLKNLDLFTKFMTLLAGRIGQVINYNSLANDTGIGANTIKEWLSILEASFVIYRLQPFYENIGRRIVKTPKLYFTEVGLAAHLLGIENSHMVARDPLMGNLFENMVVMEAVKARLNKGKRPNLYFYRDDKKNEMDLISWNNRKITPIEIKAAMTFTPSLTNGLIKFRKICPDAKQGYLVYAGEKEFESDNYNITNFKSIDAIFQ